MAFRLAELNGHGHAFTRWRRLLLDARERRHVIKLGRARLLQPWSRSLGPAGDLRGAIFVGRAWRREGEGGYGFGIVSQIDGLMRLGGSQRTASCAR